MLLDSHLLDLHELDSYLDRQEYYRDTSRCEPTTPCEARLQSDIRARNAITNQLGLNWRFRPSDWAPRCYAVSNGVARVYPGCQLFRDLMLLHQCDRDLDGIEKSVWVAALCSQSRATDERTQFLLHDMAFNPPQKQKRDTELWRRNRTRLQGLLPPRTAHDWKDHRGRGYQYTDGHFVIFPRQHYLFLLIVDSIREVN